MSVEARLQALIQSYRAQYGDAALSQSPQLIAQLSVQAPDLHGEIKALSAAINRGDAARIAAAADQEAEATKVATEIAGSEKLSMAVVTAAVAVARKLAPTAPAAAPVMPPVPPAAPSSGWAGDTVIATPPPQAPAPGYPPQAGAPGYVPPGSAAAPGGPAAPAKPIYKNPLAIGAVIVALLLFLGWRQQSETPVTNDQGSQSGPQRPGQTPVLASSGTLPTLSYNRTADGVVIPFLLQGSSAAAPGAVVLPPRGWDAGATQVVFGRPGTQGGQVEVMNEGSAQMQRMRGDGGLARAGQVQWQRDGLSMGPICIAFQSAAGQSRQQDVGLSGTTMCVMDGNCQQSIGCGRIR